MPLFWKPYKSEATQFIEQLKAQRPTLEAEQRAGRALLWDKPQDREAQAGFEAGRVAQKPYVYQTE
ncbi:MAG: DUF3460 domain-containing protein [Roseateles depolymerans]|uniref:DUF3460 domain-containing protein n=1 Tax=Roseateles depolymerans TaxID=76731 RepID=A0A2W5FPZ5_9BURK|nr:MAG: DUF3460 domain-containing protein [Roseateles depolymerans]